MAHRAPEQAQLLFRALRSDDVRLYLHVDSRVPEQPFQARGVTSLRRYPTRWGGPEIIDAMLNGTSQALADGCDYLTFLTGHGFPLQPIDEIVAFFGSHPQRSYGEFAPLEDRRRTEFYSYTVRGRREMCIPQGEDTSHLGIKGRALNWALRLRSLPLGPRQHPDYLQPMRGRLWWDLSREAARYFLEFTAAHPDLRRYHEHTWCPDEIFICSILAGSGLEIANTTLRYYEWGDGARSRSASVQDIPSMLASGALFAQKVDGAAAQELARRFGLDPELSPASATGPH